MHLAAKGWITTFLWEFILADISQPILAVDFLHTNLFLVDLKDQQLINATTFSSVLTIFSSMTAPHLNTVAATGNEFLQLLTNYPELTMPTFSNKHPKHGVENHITMHSTPVHAHVRHLPPEKLDAVKAEFDAMGVVCWSNSPWSSPLHMIAKVNGSWHPCRDYCRLNDITTLDRYSVPHIQDFLAQLAGTCIYSKVDLVRGYHQIPVHHNDITKTVIITPFGLYCECRLVSRTPRKLYSD